MHKGNFMIKKKSYLPILFTYLLRKLSWPVDPFSFTPEFIVPFSFAYIYLGIRQIKCIRINFPVYIWPFKKLNNFVVACTTAKKRNFIKWPPHFWLRDPFKQFMCITSSCSISLASCDLFAFQKLHIVPTYSLYIRIYDEEILTEHGPLLRLVTFRLWY